MIPDSVKVARIQKQQAEMTAAIEVFKELLQNPVFELVAGFTAVEMLQKYPEKKPILGGLAATTLYTGITASVAAQQMTKALPYLAKSAEGMAQLAPLLMTL